MAHSKRDPMFSLPAIVGSVITLIVLHFRLRVSTYQLLSGEPDYTTFSTNSLQDRDSGYNNVESIHGIIHSAVGGNGGHMTYIPWSAYDPAFWLHHTLVSIYQILEA